MDVRLPVAPLSPHWIARLAEPLDANAVQAAAGGAMAVQTVLRTGSTNADLLASARRAAPDRPLLRAALEQTAGRGRGTRRWHARPGSALLFSVAVPLADTATVAPAATLACAVALSDALRDAGVAIRLKWPNDLLLGDRKLGGVLAELALDPVGRRTLVVGVGINLWLDPALAASIGQPAAALAEVLAAPPLRARRETLLGTCAQRSAAAVRDVCERGFVPWHARYMSRLAWIGRPVEIVDHGARAASGTFLGVDGDGRLLLDSGGRVLAIASGEASLRAGTEATAHADRGAALSGARPAPVDAT